MLQVYKNIKARRLNLGLTQQELADRTGYTNKSAIARIEAGQIDLPLPKIELFAKALHTTGPELMGWEDSEPEALKIDHAYLSLAKDAQDKGIDPEDIRKAIEFLEDIRNGRV